METEAARLSMDEWRQELAGPLIDAFGGSPRLSLLCPPKGVADDTTKFLVRDRSDRPQGVVLCSSPVDPDSVFGGMKRARAARGALRDDLKGSILEPLREGRYCGLSYAMLPFCESLNSSRVVNRLQRMALAPAVFRWLRQSEAATTSGPPAEGVDREIAGALESLERTQGLSLRVRSTAERALDRLNAGHWVPRRTLMHGDFWLGNILIRSTQWLGSGLTPWWDRFVVIDWAGSRLDGFAFWDLFRFAQSVGASSRRLTFEIGARARMLACAPEDARSYVSAALGDLGLHLNHFPFDRYAQLADSVIADVDRALGRT
jgi:hypothetical protein